MFFRRFGEILPEEERRGLLENVWFLDKWLEVWVKVVNHPLPSLCGDLGVCVAQESYRLSRRFDGSGGRQASGLLLLQQTRQRSDGVQYERLEACKDAVPVLALFRKLRFESAVELGALRRVHGWHAINAAPTAARPVRCPGGEGLLQEGTSCRRDLVQLASVRTFRGFVLQREVLLVMPDGGVSRNRFVQGAVTP